MPIFIFFDFPYRVRCDHPLCEAGPSQNIRHFVGFCIGSLFFVFNHYSASPRLQLWSPTLLSFYGFFTETTTNPCSARSFSADSLGSECFSNTSTSLVDPSSSWTSIKFPLSW